jgi:hypothetical protein
VLLRPSTDGMLAKSILRILIQILADCCVQTSSLNLTTPPYPYQLCSLTATTLRVCLLRCKLPECNLPVTIRGP